MRIYLIAILAIVAGILLGSASVIPEFGYALDPWGKPQRSSSESMFTDGHPPVIPIEEALVPPAEGEPQPRARAESLANDFGVVEEGDRGELTYVIHNDGNATLVLDKGKSSCKCTVSEITKSEVPPGESSDIVVKYRTSVATKKFHKRFTIKTNDRENAKIEFSVIGKVLPVIKFLPRSLSAHTIVVGEPHELEARLYYYRDEPLTIHSGRFNNSKTAEFFEFSYEPLSEEELAEQGAKSGFLCRIKIKPGLPYGDSNQELSVMTNAHGRRPPRINMFLQVNEAVSVFGTKVRSGWNWSNQSLTLHRSDDSPHFSEALIVQAMGRDRADIEFKVKETVPAELKVELAGHAKEYRGKALRTAIKVSMSDDVDAQAIFDALPEKRGYVIIETTHPEYPEIKFDVRCRTAKKKTLTFGTPKQSPVAADKTAADVAVEANKPDSPAEVEAPGTVEETGETPETDASTEVTKE